MHRPLRVPFYLRVWNLIKGMLFYNTVYWQKASDGLNMPQLSREEREKARPVANLEIIRPRDKPRAKVESLRIDPFKGGQVSDPLHVQQFGEVSEPPPYDPEIALGATPTDGDLADDTKYVKRRKYKRRRVSGGHGGNGFFRRVFGK